MVLKRYTETCDERPYFCLIAESACWMVSIHLVFGRRTQLLWSSHCTRNTPRSCIGTLMSSFGSFWILISVTRSKISLLIFSQYLLRIQVQKLSTSSSTALSVLITPFAAKSCPAESKAEKNTPVFEARLICFASSVFILVFTWSFFKVKVAFLTKGTGVSFGYLLGILYENDCRLQEKACFLRRVSYTAWSNAPVVQWIGHSPAKTVIPVRLRAGALWNVSFHHNGVYYLGW